MSFMTQVARPGEEGTFVYMLFARVPRSIPSDQRIPNIAGGASDPNSTNDKEAEGRPAVKAAHKPSKPRKEAGWLSCCGDDGQPVDEALYDCWLSLTFINGAFFGPAADWMPPVTLPGSGGGPV